MTISVEEAQARLADLIRQATPGDELIVTQEGREVARIQISDPSGPQLGALAGTVLYMAPDFDEPLEDFKDYMS